MLFKICILRFPQDAERNKEGRQGTSADMCRPRQGFHQWGEEKPTDGMFTLYVLKTYIPVFSE